MLVINGKNKSFSKTDPKKLWSNNASCKKFSFAGTGLLGTNSFQMRAK
jgi:hypothetical protein